MPSEGWVSVAPYLPQPPRRGTDDKARLEIQRLRRDRLCHALASNTVIAFVGSGCSAPLKYPSWDELAITLIERSEKALRVAGRPVEGWTEERFKPLAQRVKKARAKLARLRAKGKIREVLDKAEKYFLLSIAKQILDRPSGAKVGHRNLYHDYFATEFRPDQHAELRGRSVLPELCKLPISRFITTNYDDEIEIALRGRRDQAPVEWFTQEIQHIERLTVFSLAEVELQKRLVFHCHGHYQHPESIIATERDYQRWYVSDESPTISEAGGQVVAVQGSEAAAFRQTIDLLMSSNPILFVGAGLGEEDLLRPVRMLTAGNPTHRETSQLFALLARNPDGRDDLWQEGLLERYGIQALTFEWPREPAPCPALEQALRDELKALSESLKEYQRQADQKPKIRPVELENPAPRHYWHYIQSNTIAAPPARSPGLRDDSRSDKPPNRLGQGRVDERLAEIRASFEEGRVDEQGKPLPRVSVVMLLGRGGTGKSFLATQLLLSEKAAGEQDCGAGTPRPTYDRTFFWSSYYADDLLSGVDRLLAFLGIGNHETHRLDQLLKTLTPDLPNQSVAPGRILLVLDGLERLLVPDEHPEVGRPTNEAVRRFFAALAESRPGIDVVVTSRLVPLPFLDDGDASRTTIRCRPTVARIDLKRAEWRDLRTLCPFDQTVFRQDQLSRLCSLLEGHTYTLALAASLLSRAGLEELTRKLEELCRQLAGAPPEQRPGLMIREAVKAAKQAVLPIPGEFVDDVLSRLSSQLSPAGPQVLDLAVQGDEEQEVSGAPSRRTARRHVVEELESRRLVFPVATQGDSRFDNGWTLHPTVRSFLFESDTNRPGELLPNFTLAGFTSGTGVVHPRTRVAAEALVKQLGALVEAAHLAAEKAQATAEGTQRSSLLSTARALCRSAFSTVRSRMEANTVPRWTSYPRYAESLVKLLDLAKVLSLPELWDRNDPRHLSLVESRAAPLYADELAWLYNELGLVFCSEGDMREGLRIWEQGYEINRQIERGLRPHGQYVVQSLLHLSHTYIELGRLNLAEDYLLDTHRANLDFGDPDYSARILGYRGLLAHLQADFIRANQCYTDTLKMLRVSRRNPRAEAIFSRFRADLVMHQGRLEEGRDLLERSRALADTADYPDLVAFSRNSLGRYLRAKSRFPEALREYQAAWDMARKLGIRRLEADVLSELSRLSLCLGDTVSARQHALRALRLANQLGLGLRQVHGLVVLGLAAVAEKRTELGKAYLRHARDLAFRRRYFLRGYEAQQKLEELGEPPGERAAL